MKTVVITGSNGMLGSALVEAFDNAGWAVTKITRQDCDFEDEASVRAAAKKLIDQGVPSAVVHAAWPKFSRTRPDETSSEERAQHLTFAKNSELFLSLLGRAMPHGALVGITTQALGSHGAMGGYVEGKEAFHRGLQTLGAQLPHIAVREVAPGFMKGGLNSDLSPRVFEFAEQSGTLESPQKVAQEVVRLCDTSVHAEEL